MEINKIYNMNCLEGLRQMKSWLKNNKRGNRFEYYKK